MAEFEDIQANGQIAPWMNAATFNNYYTYSFISRASFYGMINSQYYSFMNRFVKNWLWWYDGYVPYFHSDDKGIPSTKLATALVNKVATKVVGGRVMYKNAGNDSAKKTQPNEALLHISTEWAKEVDFEAVIKRAVKYAAASGTALIKLNKDAKGLWPEALRFDSFLPAIDARGNISSVKCFLRYFTNLGVNSPKEGDNFKGFYIVEYRHFADYKKATGEIIKNAPVVEYVIHQQQGSITNGEYFSQSMTNTIEFRNIPPEVRRAIGRACPDIIFNKPILLPFADSLGCELVKWTDGVSGLPELPFGESFLANIISYLMTWDYYQAAANTDMYTGRARVMIPKQMKSATGTSYNSGLDSFLFTQWQTPDTDGQKPEPLQFDLRSSSWSEIRNRLIQDISITTGLNISTIASFIQDTTAARTAREISTEENETAEYVNDKRAIIEKPLNKILRLVTKYYGFSDEVVIRWSGAGLTNRYALAEILSMAVQGGFLSQYKAVQMFNYDDDDAQVQEEYERIVADAESQSAFDDFGGNEGMNDEPTTEQFDTDFSD